MRRLNARGDTIVEVLFALVVLSSVLVGAYISSNNSFKASRQAQERGEALKFVEGQVEQLKTMAEDPATSNQIFNTADFCIANRVVSSPSSNAACSVSSVPGSNPYNLKITQASSVFTIQATWQSALGTGNDQLTILYKHNK